VPGIPTRLNVTQRLPTMLILYAESPIEDGGMPVIGYRLQYENKTLYDFDITKGCLMQGRAFIAHRFTVFIALFFHINQPASVLRFSYQQLLQMLYEY